MDIAGTFEAKGVKDAKTRLSFVAAEVREPFPTTVKEAGVDTLVMKHFLSGFSDADARTILKHCKDVMPGGGKILLLQVRALCCEQRRCRASEADCAALHSGDRDGDFCCNNIQLCKD